MGDRLIFQLGTNNWQRGGEFAPGSGILHEAHHHAYNALPGLRCYSMYPSRRQRFREEQVRVFALDHDIPICESISPTSNYRWHSMSDDEVDAYRKRLTDEVAEWIDEIEDGTGDRFVLGIAHHGFMNTVVHARRDPPPGGGRTRHDAAAVLRARHRAEDVRQREARRQPRGVPAAVPAVHAAREDLRLRRPRARRRRGRVDLGGAGRRVDSRCSRSSRASAWCSPTTATTSRSSRCCRTCTPTAPRCWPGSPPSRPRAATESPSRWRRRTGSTRSSRSAASSPTGSGWTPCCARRRSTSSTRRRSSRW